MGNNNENSWTLYVNESNFGEEFFKLVGLLDDKFKGSPNAPKDIEGSYTLTVNGRTVTLSDGKDKVEASCYYEDNFDIGEGVRQCFEKLKKARKEIKVGDMVEVVNPGDGFRRWYSWLPEERFDLIKNFAYDVPQTKGTKGKVMFIKEVEQGFTLVYYQDETGYCHTIDRRGLRKVVD